MELAEVWGERLGSYLGRTFLLKAQRAGAPFSDRCTHSNIEHRGLGGLDLLDARWTQDEALFAAISRLRRASFAGTLWLTPMRLRLGRAVPSRRERSCPLWHPR